MKGELLPVEQRHREAAAAFYGPHLARPGEVLVTAHMRAGKIDESPLIQAFAAFERDHLSDLTAQLDKAREALRGFVDNLTDHGRNRGTCLSVNHDALNARIIAARACLPATNGGVGATPENGLREALEKCRNQFVFYASEHLAAGKVEKAQTNQRYADLCVEALSQAPR